MLIPWATLNYKNADKDVREVGYCQTCITQFPKCPAHSLATMYANGESFLLRVRTQCIFKRAAGLPVKRAGWAGCIIYLLFSPNNGAMMALCAEQALKYTPRALHYQLSMKWLMFNSMFAPAAESNLLRNWLRISRVTHLVVSARQDCLYAACRNMSNYALPFNWIGNLFMISDPAWKLMRSRLGIICLYNWELITFGLMTLCSLALFILCWLN